MMLAILAESALRSLLLGSVVWMGLNLLRVRNPHLHMTSWLVVLAVSLAMPLLMHWTVVNIPVDVLPAPLPENPWSAGSPLAESLPPSLPLEPGAPAAVRPDNNAFNWLAFATAIYAAVAGMLLLRLAVGICLTWRLVRAAKPIAEPWTAGRHVRVSTVVAGPVTFGSTILLPPECGDWSAVKRRAVLAHEGAHVANRDFHVLLLASLNRVIFWFSPFAWWQYARLAELAEIISDAQALEVLDDRLSYAEILIDLVQYVRQAPAGLEMARACTVRSRVERILSATAAPARPGWRKRIGASAAILPAVVLSAVTIAYGAPPASGLSAAGASEAATARQQRSVDFYSFGRNSIFAVFREGDDLFGQLSGQRKLRLAEDGDGSYSYSSSAGQITMAVGGDRQPSEPVLSHNGRSDRAARIAALSSQSAEAGAGPPDSYAGWYELAPNRVLTITRDGDRMVAQETGRPKFELAAHGSDAFSSRRDDLVVFLRDAQGAVAQALLQDPVFGARLAPRVTEARARAIEEEFARRIAEVPDRFRDQTPLPGSKEAILHGIEGMQRGAPNYERMSAPLAARIRRQAAQMEAMFKALGAVESIFFRGVGPGGYDIYGVKFANGSAEFRLLLDADGKAEDVLFRPDGNDTPGGVAACSEESGLRSRDGTAPIQVLIFNDSGGDIQLYRLDSEGRRSGQGVIGENMSSSVLTAVDSPWLIADGSGKCLEIVLPGQRTRYHTVGRIQAGGRQESAAPAPRSAPLAGSEERLRQYIEALGRGAPDYDRMTAEVAIQTRRQLPFNQAILARLGALRAVSFRGVSSLGSDIYMVHFANGSAEWRIGLARDGTIGRIALGPQY